MSRSGQSTDSWKVPSNVTSASLSSTDLSTRRSTRPGPPGPVSPTANAVTTLSPLGLDDVALESDGYLGRWQQASADTSLPHCIANLEASGALGNLRHLAGKSDEPFRGMWFADSDVYKTLEGAAWQLAQRDTDDGALRRFVERAVTLIAAAQQDDGYLNSWVQIVRPDDRWQDLRWGHELYCAGHLIQAAVAADRTGASADLLAVAQRLADLLADRFGASGTRGICGHPEIETALVELFRATGQQRYLDLAARMIDLRGHGLLADAPKPSVISAHTFGAQYFQDHTPVREAATATGHAVRQLYLEAGVVDVAVETGDADLLAASERVWDDLFSTKTYVTGAHGSRHRDEAIGDAYELPPDRAYAETCAAIASFHWNWRLLLATGRHRYAEEMERVLYNAIAVSTAVDGKHFFYSNPLQLRAGHDGSDEDAPSQRLSWYRCACCPPNLTRLVGCLNGYLATTDATGVQVHLYAPARVRADVPGGAVALRVSTDYPWDGRIEVTVERVESDQEWTLALRIPAWADDVRASIDGEPVVVDPDAGYLRLSRTWPEGTSLVLELGMPARLVGAHPKVDAVRGSVALARGPLVYCIEDADLGPGIALDDVVLDPASPPRAAARDDLLDVPVVITAQGRVRSGASSLYSTWPPATDAAAAAPLELTAIPYFRWGNRDPGAMRVWVPISGADER